MARASHRGRLALRVARGVGVARAAGPARADEPIEIFDAHLHYNWEPKPYLQPDEVLALFKKASRHRHPRDQPSEHRHPCADGCEGRRGCRSCRSSGPIASAPTSRPGSTIPSIFDLVQEEFKRGYYRGIGEFHICRQGRRHRVGEEDRRFRRRQRSLSARPCRRRRRRNPDAAQSARADHLGAYRLRPAGRPRRGDARRNIRSCGANCRTAAASPTAAAS